MGKYETKIKVAQIHSLVEEKKYKKAAAMLGTLDVLQIRNRADLHLFAEVYMKTDQFAAAKATYLRIYKRNRTKRILHRLIYLAIRTNELEEAENYYEEYAAVSNNSREKLILRYRIDKAKGVPIERLIETLQELKDVEYIEEWAYELAKLYQQAGRLEECEQECRDIKLWFGQGEIVERAILLFTYLQANHTLPYYEDKDYTQKDPEQPNPADTGSLPDLDPSILRREKEVVRQKRLQEKEDRETMKARRKAEMAAQRQATFVDDYEKETASEEESPVEDSQDDMSMEEIDIGSVAKKGFRKIASLWKKSYSSEEIEEPELESFLDETTETSPSEIAEEEEEVAEDALLQMPDQLADISLDDADENWEFTEESQTAEPDFDEVTPEELRKAQEKMEEPEKPHTSASGTGITQNLAKEIAAIFEMEHKNQLKEKGVEVIQELQDERIEKDSAPIVESPSGMEEIGGTDADENEKQEEEVTMIELDKIMPEPDMPERKQVVPQDSPELGEQDTLSDKDLPTTRALHHSFDDMLTLIAGELEPRHFVLMGEGDARILGITKRIVRVMHQKNFLSTTQIARIDATVLNELDLFGVASQIKGSCLLIDHAAKLLFPTITRIFAIMDEFRGDFMVVLADEGTTLDEMFKVAPALARRFEYVIDISKYTEADYEES